MMRSHRYALKLGLVVILSFFVLQTLKSQSGKTETTLPSLALACVNGTLHSDQVALFVQNLKERENRFPITPDLFHSKCLTAIEVAAFATMTDEQSIFITRFVASPKLLERIAFQDTAPGNATLFAQLFRLRPLTIKSTAETMRLLVRLRPRLGDSDLSWMAGILIANSDHEASAKLMEVIESGAPSLAVAVLRYSFAFSRLRTVHHMEPRDRYCLSSTCVGFGKSLSCPDSGIEYDQLVRVIADLKWAWVGGDRATIDACLIKIFSLQGSVIDAVTAYSVLYFALQFGFVASACPLELMRVQPVMETRKLFDLMRSEEGCNCSEIESAQVTSSDTYKYYVENKCLTPANPMFWRNRYAIAWAQTRCEAGMPQDICGSSGADRYHKLLSWLER